jgi:regulator of sigma E protease
MMILGILITLLGLGVVIFVHELGHLWAAKRAGIGVIEFSIGMGPKVYSRPFNGTLYAIRAFPLGGFVKLAGMDPEDSENNIPVSAHFQSRPMSGRMLTIVAGSLMNLSFGFLLFVCLFSFSGKAIVSPTIEGVLPNSPAATVGLQAGDILQQLNGQNIQDVSKDFIQKLQQIDGDIHIQVIRDDASFDVTLSPSRVDGRAQIGVRFAIAEERQPVGFREALDMGAKTTWGHVTMVFKTLGMLFSGKVSVKDMAGPVGIIQFATAGLSHGFSQFIGIVAMISISLGIFNLFPFPVLDGGHLVLLMIEAVRGKPLSETTTNRIQQFGTVVLIALMILILFNDISQWQARWQLLGK